MTPPDLLAALDEYERRRRREFDQLRALLIRSHTVAVDTSSSQPPPPAHSDDVGPTLLVIEDVAEVLSVGESMVKKLIRTGKLPAVKVEGATRVRRSDLDAYIAALELVPTRVREAV